MSLARAVAAASALLAISIATPSRAALITWSTTASGKRCEVGARYAYACPARGALGSVWGSGPYTDDSSICTAAVHAGVIDVELGGEVVIEMRSGMPSYVATKGHGVMARSYGAWGCSFVVASGESTTAVQLPAHERAGSDDGEIIDVRTVRTRETSIVSPDLPPLTSSSYDRTGVALGMDLVFTPSMGDGDAGFRSMVGLRTMMHGRAGRRIAINIGMEEAFGVDHTGFRRYDLAWTLPEMYFYLTPDSLLQFYTLSGLELRTTHFASGPGRALPTAAPWANLYVGAFLGVGVETRISPKTAMRVELRGFLRGRVDDPTPDAAFQAATATNSGANLNVGLAFF
jgi:LCCL domain